MKEHRDTAITPTSQRRLALPKNARSKRIRSWKDTRTVNEYLGWRMHCESVKFGETK